MKPRQKIPLLAAIVIILFSLSFWVYDTTSRSNVAERALQESVQTEAQNIQTSIFSRINPVQSILIDNWEHDLNGSVTPTYDLFLNTVPIYFNLYPGYLAINFINSSGFINYVYPYERNKAAINLSVIHTADGKLNTVFLDAMETFEIQITQTIPLFQGGLGIVAYVPVIIKHQLAGFFTVVMEVSVILDIAMGSEQSHNNYAFKVIENNSEIYLLNDDFNISDEYVKNSAIEVYNLKWLLYGRLPQEIINSLNPMGEIYIVFLGIIVSAILVYLFKISNLEYLTQLELFESRAENERITMQYERQNALGTLAGGIAHEFNNLLMGIQGYLSLLRYSFDTSYEMTDEFIDYIEKIEAIILKSKDLTHQILLFSRQSDVIMDRIDVISTVRDSLRVFEVIRDRRVDISTDIDIEQAFVLGNSSYFGQCILNLLKNAEDAIPSKGLISVRISIEDDLHHISGEKILETETSMIKYLIVQVKDNGTGIKEEILTRIFDPFFTTKDIGEGTGLGLSMIYSYIKSVGGGLTVSSEVGVGTCFTLSFPLLQQTSGEFGLPLINEGMIDFQPKEPVNVLLVEDDLDIANSLASFLEKKSIDVTVANNANEALSLFKEESYEIIILDINLPIMSGYDIAQHMVQVNSDQKILFISGYDPMIKNPTLRQGRKEMFSKVIQKPFNPEDLVNAIYSML